MGILGKDLFDYTRPHTNTKIEFGDACYWVEDNPEPQPYGTVLTEILTLDAASLQGALDQIKPQDYSALWKFLSSLPLYRVYLPDLRVANEALPRFAQQTLDDIQFIQRRYGWFLDAMFEGKAFEKKKGQRKEPLVKQITDHCLEAFVSGVSLGEDYHVDAPDVKTQYVVRTTDEQKPELVEKMYFDRLLDFVYVEFMKSLQKEFVPKRCANCGRWFLQTPGATYSYCNELAPDAEGKTCREIGATTSFRDKVHNNDIWKLHQRAYKKYFARTRAGTMSKPEFETWSLEAEHLRDIALEQYENAGTDAEKDLIVQELKDQLNSQ